MFPLIIVLFHRLI